MVDSTAILMAASKEMSSVEWREVQTAEWWGYPKAVSKGTRMAATKDFRTAEWSGSSTAAGREPWMAGWTEHPMVD